MGVPRAHSTRAQKGRRRSHLALKRSIFSSCSNCGKKVMAHRVCAYCGHYGGQKVVNILAKTLKKQEKQKKKTS